MLKSQVKKPEKIYIMNFKVTEEEREIVRKNANQFTGGNISAWARYATMKLSPRPRDIAKTK